VSGSVYVCAGTHEKFRHFQIIPVGRPVQCRRTVGLSRIDIGILLQQQTQARPVSPLDRLHQVKVAAGCGQTGERQKKQKDHGRGFGTFDFVTHIPPTFHYTPASWIRL
jgi:hypothetical protein